MKAFVLRSTDSRKLELETSVRSADGDPDMSWLLLPFDLLATATQEAQFLVTAPGPT